MVKPRPFHVGVTRDLRAEDGRLALPADLSMLDGRPGLSWAFLPVEDTPISAATLASCDAIFHFSPTVTSESLTEAANRLVLIARHGVGVDMIDLEAATSYGIAVSITPDGIRRPMASAAVSLVLALAHRLPQRDAVVREGGWHEGRLQMVGMGLSGRTLGLVGFGTIGREIRRLLAPWQMQVIVATRRPLAPEAEVEDKVTRVHVDELFRMADVVVLACPLTDATRHLVNATRLRSMKPGSILVNVSRGAIADSAAVAEALDEGRLAGVGVDVFEHEPPGPDDPLLHAPNTLLAPHSLGYTDELFAGSVASACRSILTVAEGRLPPHLANPAVRESTLFLNKLARFAG